MHDVTQTKALLKQHPVMSQKPKELRVLRRQSRSQISAAQSQGVQMTFNGKRKQTGRLMGAALTAKGN